jgi:hypothetical protein
MRDQRNLPRIFPQVSQSGRSVDDKVQIGIIETITSSLPDLISRYNLKGEYSIKPGASLVIGIFGFIGMLNQKNY